MASDGATSPIQNTVRELQALIGNASLLDIKAATTIADKFKSLSSSLTRQHKHAEKIHQVAAINPNDRSALLQLIKEVEHSPDFLSQLGSQQSSLLRTLHEIRSHVTKWEHKVTNVENDRS